MPVELAATYRAYIACLNGRGWDELPSFVHEEVEHNGCALGVAGYRAMLESDVESIPDLRFAIDLLVVDAPRVASRLLFDCRPRDRFMGLDVAGRRIRFAENVFYAFEGGLIRTVWSVIDKASIEAQLR